MDTSYHIDISFQAVPPQSDLAMPTLIEGVSERSLAAKTKNKNPCLRCKGLKRKCDGDGRSKCTACQDLKTIVVDCVYEKPPQRAPSNIASIGHGTHQSYHGNTITPTEPFNTGPQGDGFDLVSPPPQAEELGVANGIPTGWIPPSNHPHPVGKQVPIPIGIQVLSHHPMHSEPLPQPNEHHRLPMPGSWMYQPHFPQAPHYVPDQTGGQFAPDAEVNANVFLLQGNPDIESGIAFQGSMPFGNKLTEIPASSWLTVRPMVAPVFSNKLAQDAIPPGPPNSSTPMVYDPGTQHPHPGQGVEIGTQHKSGFTNSTANPSDFILQWVHDGDYFQYVLSLICLQKDIAVHKNITDLFRFTSSLAKRNPEIFRCI
ncbi:hypothetical protein SCHPADRAFT_93512 [Schizopora paradoxa]|uniref:Zn(2)-C6 fungal-type domain-containing protein n=1 Tax=Schizopora paradoxa TaxID=27342 RepID=A0A0H2S4A7_9AGAM|nr:hypothetical protein SCHPADRAFT_93512 [Schizopora paradoxa]